MTGPTHALTAVTALVVVNTFAPGTVPAGWPTVAAGVLAVIGGLLPDIDSDESTIRQATATNRGAARWLIGGVISATGGHRNMTHTLAALMVVAVIGILSPVPAWAWQALTLGYGSHLLADMLTPQGLPLFWPLHGEYQRLPRWLTIRTGSGLEYLFAVAIGVGCVLMLWR